MKALVLNNKVVDLAQVEFPVSEEMRWVLCDHDTEIGWDVDGENIIRPASDLGDLERVRAQKIDELASLRFLKETSGFTLQNGVFINTDDRSKTLMLGARLEAMRSPEIFSINWKTPQGFVTLNAAEMIAISDAVRAFVQSCFDTEMGHIEAIRGLSTIEQIKSYDINSGW